MSEVSTIAGGYRYGGTLADAPGPYLLSERALAQRAAARARRTVITRERWQRLAEARAASPGLTWAELAAGLGMTKGQAKACWHRLLAAQRDSAP
jgi:hypothetical protein